MDHVTGPVRATAGHARAYECSYTFYIPIGPTRTSSDPHPERHVAARGHGDLLNASIEDSEIVLRPRLSLPGAAAQTLQILVKLAWTRGGFGFEDCTLREYPASLRHVSSDRIKLQTCDPLSSMPAPSRRIRQWPLYLWAKSRRWTTCRRPSRIGLTYRRCRVGRSWSATCRGPSHLSRTNSTGLTPWSHSNLAGQSKNHFGRTDRGETGILDFLKTHKCNALCKLLKLPPNLVYDPNEASSATSEQSTAVS